MRKVKNRVGNIEHSPPKRKEAGSYFLLAVIISLTIHAVILAVMWGWPAGGGPKEDDLLTEMDVMEITEALEEKIPDAMREEDAEEIRNVESNMEAARSSEAISYRSKEKIADDVYRDLKNFEKQVFDELKQNKSGIQEPEPETKKYTNTKEMYEQTGQKQSYGSAMVSYLLQGRESKNLPVPGYKCKASGKVVVDIEVDPIGKVLSAAINTAQTTTSNECLMAEALDYARKSSFFAKPTADKKQTGIITYLFMAQ